VIGRRLSHYRIEEQLGAGGMGEVYRARDEKLGRDVALKVLPAGALADEEARRRFRKEAEALSRLSHPHVATLHDVDTADGIDFRDGARHGSDARRGASEGAPRGEGRGAAWRTARAGSRGGARARGDPP
jgi:hypothetical protein